MSLRMTCLYRYNAELRKTQSLKAVLVGELCGLISRQCRHLLKGELKRRCCLDFILVCRLCLAAYELLERTIPLSRGQERSMCRFTLNLRSCIKRVTHWDNSQSRDVWSPEETSSLSSDAQQDDEYKASKGHTRTRRR